MEFRGTGRLNKPQSGLFNSHYLRRPVRRWPGHANYRHLGGAIPRHPVAGGKATAGRNGLQTDRGRAHDSLLSDLPVSRSQGGSGSDLGGSFTIILD